MTYTIGLALEDFVPVILSGIGLFIISQMATRINGRIGRMATIGWALVFIGGLLKAVWKLIIAFTNAQTNIVWMDKGMFLWMSIGFTLLAFAVWYIAQIMRGKSTPQRIWVAPGIIIALILFAIFATGFPDFAINTWRFILLGMMTIGNVTLIVLLIIKARRFGLTGTAVLFTLNIIIAFTMSGLARIPDQTIPLQWTEQLLNSFGQGAFMLAAFQLAKAVSVQNKTAVPAD